VWILLVASDIATRCAPTMAVERGIGRPAEPLLTAKWRLQKTAFERGVVLATGAVAGCVAESVSVLRLYMG